MCVGTDITHLMYVNYLLLFARADESTITLIKDCIEEFGSIAGLQPNLKKSSLYLVGVNDHLRGKLLEIIGFQ